VINNLYPPQELGGYGRRVCDFANVLRERGHTIQVLTSDAPYLGEVKSLEDDVERSLLLCGTYEKLPPQYLTDSFKLTQILHHNDRVIRAKINNYAPDACLVGNIDLLTHTLFEPLLQNKIPVVHLLGFAQTGYTVPDAPTSPLYHIAANSEFGRQSILSQGYPFEDIGIVYPGAFIDQFQMCTLPNLERLRIVFAGLVMPYKGPQTLVEALSILHDADVDFQCAIAGASPLEGFIDELRAFVEAKGLENQVEFLGYLQRPQLIELFATHNVLVFPSVWEEPFGRSQVEAMAAGLTLITSGTGGSGEVIEPGVSGLTFPAGNAAALAEALMSLPKNRQRWESIATAGQKRAELFSIERSVDSIEEKFDELLKRRDNEGEFEHQKLQADLQNRLQLKEINIVIFPDWSQAEEFLSLELAQVIKVIATHPDQSHMTLLVDTSNIPDEDAELAISGVVMNLLMEEDLDVTSGAEISLIGKLSQSQWEALLPNLQARIVLENENKQAIALLKAETIPSFELDRFSSERFKQRI
jgi:glycosyltransferase involved in cell wall biosynthesis